MTTFTECSTDAAANLKAGQILQVQGQAVKYLEENGIPFLVTEEGDAESLESLLKQPIRLRAKPSFLDAASFIEYIKLYQTAGTLIFSKIDLQGGAFVAVLDHPAPGETSWNEHHATFSLQTTPDWKLWVSRDKQWMKQDEFVQFVEQQRHVFADPSSATMLEIAMSIEAAIGGNYKSAFRNDNGDRTLVLDMSTVASYGKAEAKLPIPSELTVILAPFEGQNPVHVSAFLRFRPQPDGVKFQYELQRPEEAIRVSAEEARTRISGETGKPVLNGAPTPRS